MPCVISVTKPAQAALRAFTKNTAALARTRVQLYALGSAFGGGGRAGGAGFTFFGIVHRIARGHFSLLILPETGMPPGREKEKIS